MRINICLIILSLVFCVHDGLFAQSPDKVTRENTSQDLIDALKIREEIFKHKSVKEKISENEIQEKSSSLSENMTSGRTKEVKKINFAETYEKYSYVLTLLSLSNIAYFKEGTIVYLCWIIDALFITSAFFLLTTFYLFIRLMFQSSRIKQTRRGVELLAMTIKSQEERIRGIESLLGE